MWTPVTLRRCIFLLLAVSVLCACSNRSMYEAIQRNRQVACMDKPQPLYEECMNEHDLTYAEYERRREEILQKQESGR